MERSTVIYGAPGCGKSTAVIEAMKERIRRGVEPQRIGLISFTRAAAQELAKRAGAHTGNAATLHSYAFRLLNLSREQVVDKEKLRELANITKVEVTGASVYDEEQAGRGDHYLSILQYARATRQDENAVFKYRAQDGTLPEFKYFVDHYRRWKEANGYVDFDDMLEQAIGTTSLDLDVLFLDEAQDFSPLQWELIYSWIEGVAEVVVALDDDQAVHEWAGASPEHTFDFERRHGSERIVLDQSHRLPKVLRDNAVRFIHGAIRNRVDKKYEPVNQGGTLMRHGGLRSVRVPSPTEDTLILVRNHKLREEVEEWLLEYGVPYITDSGMPGPFQSRLAGAIQAWRKAQENVANIDMPALNEKQWRDLRTMALPSIKEAVKREEIEPLISKHWSRVLRAPKRIIQALCKVEKRYGNPTPQTSVHISTIHGSKGREADRVVLYNAATERTARNATAHPEGEARVWYVGLTRARKTLDIVRGENPFRGV